MFFVVLTFVQFLIIYLLFIVGGSSYSFNWLNLVELIFAIALLNSLIGFLIGLVMKESKGQANPKIVNQIINRLINES